MPSLNAPASISTARVNGRQFGRIWGSIDQPPIPLPIRQNHSNEQFRPLDDLANRDNVEDCHRRQHRILDRFAYNTLLSLDPEILWGFLMPQELSPRHAVYVGSFDPPSLGHEDIIRRGARIFDKLTVGIGINPEKRPLFTPEERRTLLQTVLKPMRNVEVDCFEGLAVSFVRSRGASVMLRGVRTLTDIESEFTMSLANRTLAPDIESVFLMSSDKYTHISSSLIKQIAQLGDEDSFRQLSAFVPAPVIEPLVAKFRKHP